jgi:hypothetical protein
MKWRVVTENVVDLDWDHVKWTDEGKKALRQYRLEIKRTGVNRVHELGQTVEWAYFEENWLTEALLVAKEESHVGNLGGTICFGFDHEGVVMIETEPDFVTTKIGYIGWNASEDAPLLDKAETFAEAV